MTITREDAELIADAIGATVVKPATVEGWSFKVGPSEYWHVTNDDWLKPILDLAKRAGPKPRIAEDEASIISVWLNLSYQSADSEYVFHQFDDNFSTVAHMAIRFDSPLWNKLLKLAKEAKS